TQEAHELNSLPQAAVRHLPAAEHLLDDVPDLRGPEVEPPIEPIHAVENLITGEMWIAERGDLYTIVVDQAPGVVRRQPAVLHGLAVEIGSRIGCRQRHLDGVWVDVDGELYGLLDGLAGLTRQPENEGAVDQDPKLVAVLGKTARNVSAQALLD